MRLRIFRVPEFQIPPVFDNPKPNAVASVVITLDELFDVAPQMVQILVLVGVNLFPLERLDEALAAGVVVRVWLAGSCSEPCHVFSAPQRTLRGILNATIGMVHQPWQRPPFAMACFKASTARRPPAYDPGSSPPPCAKSHPESPPDTRTPIAAGCR